MNQNPLRPADSRLADACRTPADESPGISSPLVSGVEELREKIVRVVFKHVYSLPDYTLAGVGEASLAILSLLPAAKGSGTNNNSAQSQPSGLRPADDNSGLDAEGAGVRRTFLIAPVRGRHPNAWESAVAMLEEQGWQVHWPARDTDQSDPVGLDICQANVEAIRDADAVHVIWDGQSLGCVFDLGAAFALGKPVLPIELPEPTPGKSLQNMVRAWAT